jgi:prophage regulatory protein
MHRILRLSEVKVLTGLARSTIYKKIADDSFPAQIPLGAKSVGWLERDIQDWIQEKISLSQIIKEDNHAA